MVKLIMASERKPSAYTSDVMILLIKIRFSFRLFPNGLLGGKTSKTFSGSDNTNAKRADLNLT